jgi:solute carrier family 35 (UDP-sugar transporter), member A1/2/3
MSILNNISAFFSFKYIALAMLVFQNTFLIIFMSMSRTSKDESSKLYATSTAVVVMEVVKLVSCICVVYYESLMITLSPTSACVKKGPDASLYQKFCPDSLQLFFQTIHNEMVAKPAEFIKCSVPSLLYTIQNNLLYYALSHLDAATFQVGYQMKILTTAVFSYFMLNKRLSREQWGSLVILTAGVSMAQLSSQNGGLNAHSNTSMGFLAVAAAAVTSGFSGVYFERILKTSSASIWIRNIQMSLFSIVIALITVYSQESDYQSVLDNGFFYGYTNIVWSVIFLQAVGGLVVAVVVKYADNILKGFAASFSIITSCILSIFLIDFKPTLLFLCGAVLVNVAMYVYGKYPHTGATQALPTDGSGNARPGQGGGQVRSRGPNALAYLTQTKAVPSGDGGGSVSIDHSDKDPLDRV